MNKRVHLPADERREQIVQGALKIFAEKGFDSTTNKEIARVAGLASPGLIYHYFQDKASLLRAVIESHMGQVPRMETPEALLKLPLREGLLTFVRQFLGEISDPKFVAFVRVLLGEAMRRPMFASILSNVLMDRMFNEFQTFFQRHQKQGALGPVDLTATTMRFIGSTVNVFLMREVLQIPAVRALDMETLEKSLVDDFLNGVAP